MEPDARVGSRVCSTVGQPGCLIAFCLPIIIAATIAGLALPAYTITINGTVGNLTAETGHNNTYSISVFQSFSSIARSNDEHEPTLAIAVAALLGICFIGFPLAQLAALSVLAFGTVSGSASKFTLAAAEALGDWSCLGCLLVFLSQCMWALPSESLHVVQFEQQRNTILPSFLAYQAHPKPGLGLLVLLVARCALRPRHPSCKANPSNATTISSCSRVAAPCGLFLATPFSAGARLKGRKQLEVVGRQ